MFSVVADDQGYWALPGRAVKLHHGPRRDCDARLDLNRRVTWKVKEMLSIVSIGLKRDISAISYRISIGIRANVHVTIAPKPKATMMAATVMMIPMDMIGYL